MDKITLQSGVKRIQVNESGDCITFDARDQGFTERFMKLLKDFPTKKRKIPTRDKTRGLPLWAALALCLLPNSLELVFSLICGI